MKALSQCISSKSVDTINIQKFMPYLVIFCVQIGYTLLSFISEASFKHGLDTHVYVTYRNIVGGLVMFPVAYFLERKQRPKLTLPLLLEIFILSLLGMGLTLNTYFSSLCYTSPSFVASIMNSLGAITFVIAVALRLEALDIRKNRGVAKIVGTAVSFAGVTTMTMYRGPTIKSTWRPLIRLDGGTNACHENWVKGSLFAVSSSVTWSIWFIMQAYSLKKYPAPLSLTTWMNIIGAAQSALFAVGAQRRLDAWKIGFNIDFWNILYGGIVVSGVMVVATLWCLKARGPVFVTMFNPLSTVLVTLISFLVMGEKLYTGSIIGAVVVALGMYLLLWGKEYDALCLHKVGSNHEVQNDLPK